MADQSVPSPAPAPLPTGSASVIVKNVAPTTDPPTHKVLADFFSFCGNIAALSITPVLGDETTVTAVVTFENEAAAKTAVLLNNALINDRAITVELAPQGFQPPTSSVAADQLPHTATGDQQRTEASVIQAMVDAGYKLSSDAYTQAKAWDEQAGITQTLSSGIAVITAKMDELDQSWQLSTKAKAFSASISTTAAAVDQQYQISAKAGEATGQAINFFQETANTIATGTTVAVDSVTNLVNTPQVSQGVQAVQAVGTVIGQSIADTFGSIVSAVTNAVQPSGGSK